MGWGSTLPPPTLRYLSENNSDISVGFDKVENFTIVANGFSSQRPCSIEGSSSMSRDFVSLLMGLIIRFCWKPISCLAKTRRCSSRSLFVQKSSRRSDSRLEGLMALRVSNFSSLNHTLWPLLFLRFELLISSYASFFYIASHSFYPCTYIPWRPRHLTLHNATTLVRTSHPHPQPRALSTATCRPNTRELSGHGSYG